MDVLAFQCWTASMLPYGALGNNVRVTVGGTGDGPLFGGQVAAGVGSGGITAGVIPGVSAFDCSIAVAVSASIVGVVSMGCAYKNAVAVQLLIGQDGQMLSGTIEAV
jgi:hypothetical protein